MKNKFTELEKEKLLANLDALGHAPWNPLHSIKLDGIHCI